MSPRAYAVAGHAGQDRGEGADRVGVAGGQGDPAGQFRDGRARLRRGSWWRRRGSSRRTSRLWGRGGWSCGVPRTLRGRRSRCCRGAGGGRRFPRRSSRRPARLRRPCARPGCWLPAGHPAPRRGRRRGCRPGVFAQRLGDEAEGALGLPVGELVRAGLPVLQSRRAGAWSASGRAVRAAWTSVRCAGRRSARASMHAQQ